MRSANVYRNGHLAGTLTEASRNSYFFRYTEAYFLDKKMPAISLTMPKTQQEYHSQHLFPIFSNLLSEGVNRKLQSTQLHVDEADDMGLLLATARYDTIGAITVKSISE